MTPDKAFEIFWNAYEESYGRAKGEGKVITQPDLYQDALKAVIEACEEEFLKIQAEQYLAKNENDKQLNYIQFPDRTD